MSSSKIEFCESVSLNPFLDPKAPEKARVDSVLAKLKQP